MTGAQSQMQPGSGCETALVLADARHAETETEALADCVPGLLGNGLRIVSQTSGVGMLPPNREVVASVYLCDGLAAQFDQVVLGRNVRVFKAPWGRALLGYVNAMVRPNGRVVLPVVSDAVAERDGMWSLDDLRALFGAPGHELGASVWAFPHRDGFVAQGSVLSWYLDDPAGAVHAELMSRYIPLSLAVHRLDDMLLEVILDRAEQLVTSPRTRVETGAILADSTWYDGAIGAPDHPAISYGQAHSNALKSISYLVTGIGYKAAIVRHIVKENCQVNGGLTHVDFGGGIGLLGAELLLDDELRVAKAVCCDATPNYLLSAMRLYRTFRAEFRTRFFFSASRAEDFAWDQQYSVVTFISSLLYMDQDRREEILMQAWDHVEPGGVLVLFEVPKQTPPSKDDAIQFTADELDGMLGKLGEVLRYSATGARRITVDEAANYSIFRAVAKPL